MHLLIPPKQYFLSKQHMDSSLTFPDNIESIARKHLNKPDSDNVYKRPLFKKKRPIFLYFRRQYLDKLFHISGKIYFGTSQF